MFAFVLSIILFKFFSFMKNVISENIKNIQKNLLMKIEYFLN